jgi:hypothetical protein
MISEDKRASFLIIGLVLVIATKLLILFPCSCEP